MLTIKNLKARVDNKEILKGIDLNIKSGEVHAIMGQNGSGKSTLANVLAGNPDFRVVSGSIDFKGGNLSDLSIEERATEGLFLSMQNPVELPGVNNLYFLKAALNSLRKKQGKSELDAFDFTDLVHKKMQVLNLDEKFLERSVNEGFSGGEKKRNEVLQMLILEPKLIVLDEIDSGLDIDALKVVAAGINSMRNTSRSILMITHYKRLLNYIVPDYIHVLMNGRIILSGDKKLADELENKGYDWLKEEKGV